MAGGGGGGGGSSQLEFGILTSQFEPDMGLAPASPPTQQYEVQYNWPYDYLSIVEGAKIDVTVLWDDISNRGKSLISTGLTFPDPTDSAVGGYVGGGGGLPTETPVVTDGSTSSNSGPDAVLDLLSDSSYGGAPASGQTAQRRAGTIPAGVRTKKF